MVARAVGVRTRWTSTPNEGPVKRKTRLFILSLTMLVALGGLLHYVYRPWQKTWGATREETARRMIGDDVVENPSFVATRGVTINAKAEAVWPWIVQVGYRQAGFYSYDRLDNDGIPSAERILPAYQDLAVGDKVPLSKDSEASVAALKKNEYLLLVFEPDSSATWAWELSASEDGTTRLLTRLRVQADSFTSRLMLEYFEIIMMRKCMLGIKNRAEALAHESIGSGSPG